MTTRTSRHVTQLQTRLSEAFDDLYDSLVDPHESLWDVDGAAWLPLSGGLSLGGSIHCAFTTESQHREIRNQCRALALANEFAINGHENRVSYLVGNGHTYRAAAKKHIAAPEGLAADVQAVIDAFVRENRWRYRQEEIVRRRDRDGEVFLRFFVAPDGGTRLRFIEPAQVTTPPEQAADPTASFGIVTDRDDVETVHGYYVDGQLVPAEDVQHRKGNVDCNVKRGLPLFYPVRKNLRRAEKLLRNMSVLAEIQSAIALIRKHHGGTAAGIQQFVANQADLSATDPTTGKTATYRRYAPGTIIDANAGVEYEYPAAGIDAGNFVTILKAELRAIASRLVMPEFMLTSDASNANYASTLVAEGPAVKMFQRLQAQLIEEDLDVMWRVIGNAVDAGRLPPETPQLVEIQVAAPSLSVRDELKDVHAMRIEHQAGILSAQSWSQKRGYDYDQEQANFRARRVAKGTGSSE